MKKDNKGFTFIEVIVVMAIMAVLVGMGAQIFGLAENGYIKNASSDLKTLIDKAAFNTQAVAAKEWKIEITKEDDNYVAKLIKVESDDVETEEDRKYLSGGKKLQILFDSTFASQEVTKSTPVTISFEKQTGEVSKVTVGGVSYSGSDLQQTTTTDGKMIGGIGDITITTTNTSVHDKTIKIYWSTGKVVMK